MDFLPEGPKSGWRNVVEASIEASQVALSALTGRPVIGVFHTLSAGNAGHWVPGITVPTVCAAVLVGVVACDPDATEPETVTNAMSSTIEMRPTVIRLDRVPTAPLPVGRSALDKFTSAP